MALLYSKHYVYYHIDPKTNKLMYIGKGSGGRAWQCSPTDRHNKKHYDWIKALLEEGYTPEDFVQIVTKDVSCSEALIIESKMIRRWKPEFNNLGVAIDTCLDEKQQKRVIQLREQNISYDRIAQELGVAAMTVHRFYKQRTNNRKEHVQ